MNKKIIVSVISDVVTDQRVQKECNTLHNAGYKVLVLGRKSKNTFLLNKLPYKVIRFQNIFRRGPFMYLVFNTQIFFYLLFQRTDVLWANDLDTLLPNFIISRFKNCKLVYDSHEYFTQSVYNKTSRKIWHRLEKLLFPRLKNIITVNNSIKRIYVEEYKIPVTVIRNVPYKHFLVPVKKPLLPAHKKKLIMQGMGLNENRGAEEAVLAMQFLPEDFHLYFIGSGTIINTLKQMVRDLHLTSKITFVGVMAYDELMTYTNQCFLGLIFEKIDVSDQHLFALPNKFFDYIKAGIPILSSKAIEIASLIEYYDMGDTFDSFEPHAIADKIVSISKNEQQYHRWKKNTVNAAADLCWENEEKILIEFMDDLR